MRDEHNPLLAQIPLTVSPFLTLPRAPTLPHNYTSLPSTLPPSSITPNTNTNDPTHLPAYVTSPSGFAAHPSTIIAQNSALLSRLENAPKEAAEKVREWEEGIRTRELAEKRRRAPGWLDREEKILRPSRAGEGGDGGRDGGKDAEPNRDGDKVDLLSGDEELRAGGGEGEKDIGDLGDQMDRAFGQMG